MALCVIAGADFRGEPFLTGGLVQSMGTCARVTRICIRAQVGVNKSRHRFTRGRAGTVQRNWRTAPYGFVRSAFGTNLKLLQAPQAWQQGQFCFLELGDRLHWCQLQLEICQLWAFGFVAWQYLFAWEGLENHDIFSFRNDCREQRRTCRRFQSRAVFDELLMPCIAFPTASMLNRRVSPFGIYL